MVGPDVLVRLTEALLDVTPDTGVTIIEIVLLPSNEPAPILALSIRVVVGGVVAVTVIVTSSVSVTPLFVTVFLHTCSPAESGAVKVGLAADALDNEPPEPLRLDQLIEVDPTPFVIVSEPPITTDPPAATDTLDPAFAETVVGCEGSAPVVVLAAEDQSDHPPSFPAAH